MASTPKEELQEKRQAQLLACAKAAAKLAKHRDIKPILAGHVIHDLEIRRVLDTVVRRWTLMVETSFVSAAAANPRGGKPHREHIVPIRVLVDRMIMRPSQCRALLETAVIIANVTPREHRKLGGIFTHFKKLYRRMLKAPVSEPPRLGRKRYTAKRIRLRRTIRSRRGVRA